MTDTNHDPGIIATGRQANVLASIMRKSIASRATDAPTTTYEYDAAGHLVRIAEGEHK